MNRSLVSLRDADVHDAPFLAELWQDVVRRGDTSGQIADLELIIKTAVASPEQRIVIAECSGELAGAVYLRVGTVTPLNLEPVMQAVSPHVKQQFRRRGVGRALMRSAVTFAEEQGVGHVMAGASSASRDANRFFARIALGPHAVLRIAPTVAVRAKLDPGLAAAPAPGHPTRPLSRVLAARRSARRQAVTTPHTS